MTDTTLIGARYRDASLPIEDRVADLLGRMTQAEKIAQLGAVWPAQFSDGETFDAQRAQECAAEGIGQVTRISGSTLADAETATSMGNAVQRWLREETRLGIPAILHEESLHGLTALGAVVHPQSINMASTWRPELVERMATYIGRATAARGSTLVLSPIFDITRDPRWGRTEETYGEDTYLAMELGCAYTRGVQAEGVVACGKHLVGHGLPEGGMNRAPTHIGPRELREHFLLPFEAAVRQEKLGTMMHAYGEIDGQPCVSSHELLTGILRDEWGFEGVVVSDYDGVNELIVSHKMTDDLAVAAAATLKAGMDMELPRTIAYGEHLGRALDSGLVEESVLDLTVARVLRVKFEMGLFDSGELPFVEIDQTEEREHALRIARESVVLLENDGVLPLSSAPGRVAVIGPSADDPRNLVGDYAHQLHIDTILDQLESIATGVPVAGTVHQIDPTSSYPTVFSELSARLDDVSHSPGGTLWDATDEDIEAAAVAAAEADVAVVVLGERSGLTDDAISGEARDRMDIGLPGRQQDLLEAVVASGTPVVLVLIAGRPLAIPWAQEHCAAILHAWVPGERGGEAIADVLTGAVNPGGKLPITVPRDSGQIPVYYSHRPTGGHSNWKIEYQDGSNLPLWPFGFGRSYTSFELSDLRLSTIKIPADGEVEISAAVRNTGTVAGDEVVQLYVRDVAASLTRPIKELRGFARVTLEPGQSRSVTFTLAAEQLAFVDQPGRWLVEPGEFRLMVGSSSVDLPLEASLTVGGTARHIESRSRYLTQVSVR